MTSIKDFTGPEQANLFIGAAIGFAVGLFIAPLHQDKASQTKAFIFEVVGAIIGFVIAYIWISYRHEK